MNNKLGAPCARCGAIGYLGGHALCSMGSGGPLRAPSGERSSGVRRFLGGGGDLRYSGIGPGRGSAGIDQVRANSLTLEAVSYRWACINGRWTAFWSVYAGDIGNAAA